ncbi:hypothetical protein [Corynebacterium glyciniphilum]|uniref:hypothetical protein n=1 Tax=Corynebacterium glyciniphilum TaxID=1404244 RepID=UPI00264E8515|nr:hypothetical protein [Corynebacterium glyciniphilum]MDN5684378.1 hypothetical protein [Corynebacterium glyciniphilum]
MTEQNSEQTNNLPDINESDGDLADHRRPLLNAARSGAVGLLVITVISLALWGNFRGLEGLWGVLIGAAVGGGFVLATVAVVLLTSNTSPQTTMIVTLGSWLIKIVVVLGILLVLREMDFFDHTAMGVTVIAALVVALGAVSMGFSGTKVTNV